MKWLTANNNNIMIYEYINSESELGDLEYTIGIQNTKLIGQKVLVTSKDYLAYYKKHSEYVDQLNYFEEAFQENGEKLVNAVVENTQRIKEVHHLFIFKFNDPDVDMVLGDSNRFLFKCYVVKLKDKEIVELPRLESRVNIEVEYKKTSRFSNKENNSKDLKKGCLVLLEHNFYLNERCDALFTLRFGLLYTKI